MGPKFFFISVMLFIYTMSCMACVICVKVSMKLMSARFDAWMERMEKRGEEYFHYKEHGEQKRKGESEEEQMQRLG